MRNLWLFILRFHAFFLFVLFEAIAIFLLIQNNDYQRTSFINSSDKTIGRFYAGVSDVKGYLQLGRVNDSLAIENAELRNLLPEVYYDNIAKRQTIIDSIKTDSLRIKQYSYMDAKVVNNTVNQRNNYLTIDRGSLHGVRTGDAVICGEGVVGMVKDVSEHYSTVMSFLHKDSKASVRLANSNEIGSAEWGGTNPRYALLKEIPNHVPVKKGEKVIATGYSKFPENTVLGIVSEEPEQTGDSFFTITVRLSTDFQGLRYVYVVQDKFKDEKTTLEAKLKHD